MRLATAINSPTRGATHTTRKLTLPNHEKMKHSELVKKVALAMTTFLVFGALAGVAPRYQPKKY